MKSLRTIFRYVTKYPKLIYAYFGFNILSNLFSVVSLGLLSPFLLLIFKKQNTLGAVAENTGFLSKINPVNHFKIWLYYEVQRPGGEVKALGIICILILAFIILKNVFLYLSIYVLTPMRNLIVNDMRTSMYKKILVLPVGYFNDQKKGDIMSRLTNDLSDVETSSINLLESLFQRTGYHHFISCLHGGFKPATNLVLNFVFTHCRIYNWPHWSFVKKAKHTRTGKIRRHTFYH